MSLRGAIASLTQGGPYTVTRTTNGALVKGKAQAGTNSTLSVAGSLQSVSGRELQALPESFRGDEVRVLYTLTELRTVSESHAADRVTIGGESWLVIKVEVFPAFGDTHYRVYVARRGLP